jgi:hypothetical protein
MRALLVTALLAGCSAEAATPRKGTRISLFFISELKGTLEPCGCTSDPLGDISRTARQILGADRPAALFDGGSTMYLDDPVPPEKKAQAELTADAIARILPTLRLAAAGLGPYDLAGVRFPRQAANVTAGAPVEPPKIVDVGGVKVGVFGVVAPAAVPGVTAGDPAAAARAAIAALRRQGARIVVALAHMGRADARRLARDAPGADFMLVGKDLPDEGVATPDVVGATVLLMPGNRGQVLSRLDLHLDGDGPIVDAIGPDRAAAETAKLDKRVADLEKDLARWKKDPDADKSFLGQKQLELTQLRRERAGLAARPLRAPAKGSWFVARPVRINKRLPCDAQTVAQKRKLDAAIGGANLAAARDEKPVPPDKGKAGFVGVEDCGSCHQAAVAFWKKTRHAGAWETLETIGKQWNRDCIGCHVTGWAQPGGASFAANEHLRDVQCESCHGPASLHSDALGKDKPPTLARSPAAELCATQCHTPEHSDTFQLEAYLRDVTGKGHGEQRRAALGPGPTGRELRSAALAKAGRSLGKGCLK